MKYIKQLFIIVFIAYLGETLNYFIPLPVPGSIYGLVILFIALNFKILKIEQIETTARYLLAIMPVMFVSPAAKLVSSWDVVKGTIIQGAVICIVTMVIGMVVIGRVVQAVIRSDKKKQAAKAAANESAEAAAKEFIAEEAAVEAAEEIAEDEAEAELIVDDASSEKSSEEVK